MTRTRSASPRRRRARACRSPAVQSPREATTSAATRRRLHPRRRHTARNTGVSLRRSRSVGTTIVEPRRTPVQPAMRIHVPPTSTPTHSDAFRIVVVKTGSDRLVVFRLCFAAFPSLRLATTRLHPCVDALRCPAVSGDRVEAQAGLPLWALWPPRAGAGGGESTAFPLIQALARVMLR